MLSVAIVCILINDVQKDVVGYGGYSLGTIGCRPQFKQKTQPCKVETNFAQSLSSHVLATTKSANAVVSD